jgi:hypothetical protein
LDFSGTALGDPYLDERDMSRLKGIKDQERDAESAV